MILMTWKFFPLINDICKNVKKIIIHDCLLLQYLINIVSIYGMNYKILIWKLFERNYYIRWLVSIFLYKIFWWNIFEFCVKYSIVYKWEIYICFNTIKTYI